MWRDACVARVTLGPVGSVPHRGRRCSGPSNVLGVAVGESPANALKKIANRCRRSSGQRQRASYLGICAVCSQEVGLGRCAPFSLLMLENFLFIKTNPFELCTRRHAGGGATHMDRGGVGGGGSGHQLGRKGNADTAGREVGRGQSSEVEETRSPLVCACCMPGRSWDVAGSGPGACSIAAPPAAGRARSAPASSCSPSRRKPGLKPGAGVGRRRHARHRVDKISHRNRIGL